MKLQNLPKKIKEKLLEVVGSLKSLYFVESVVLYGSFARGDFHDTSDVDLLVILSNPEKENETMRTIWKIDERYGNTHKIEVIVKTLEDFLKSDVNLLESVLREGILLCGSPVQVSIHDLELEPFVIFAYQMHGLNHKEKVMLNRALYGSQSIIGAVGKYKGIRLGRGSFMVHQKYSMDTESILKLHGVKYKKIDVWMPSPPVLDL